MISGKKTPTWIVPLAMSVLVGVFGWWGTGRLRQTVENQLKAELAATLEANVTALDIWMKNEGKLVTSLAQDPQVRELALRALAKAKAVAEGPTDQTEFNELLALLKPRLSLMGYDLIQLVSTNQLSLSPSPRRRGRGWTPVYDEHVEKFSELFSTGQPVVITPFKPKRSRFPGRPPGGPPGEAPARPFSGGGASDLSGPPGAPPGFSPPRDRAFPSSGGRPRFGDLTLMQVAAPIRDEDGRIRGALALIINPEAEFTHILSVARSGESGETYALDEHGMLLSRSRFDDQLKKLGLLDVREGASSALNLRLSDPGVDFPAQVVREDPTNSTRALTFIAANAVSSTNGLSVVPSRDYRGIPVVGAWRWLPQHGFGVATQVDASEAFRPLGVLKVLFVMLFLLLLVCTLLMFLFSYLHLMWQRRLNEAELRVKQLGQYKLEEKIGEGGMGVVYRAHHSLMRRETAVKLLLPNRADSSAIERFEREVCLTCQLTHPNTIQVYDYGHTPEGIFYYAMELLRGLTLSDLVARYGPQLESRVIYILVQICGSLEEAHDRGLIHRDIKPANVFLCRLGGVPDCVKVLDFGLVCSYRSATTDGGQDGLEAAAVGTPLFMPPEALTDPLRSDPRSDLYSLGALAYHLLTGCYVFESDTVEGLYEKHKVELPLPLSARTRNPISPELEQIILSCLEKDPTLRPGGAAALRDRLLGTPAARSWTLEDRKNWWAAYQSSPDSHQRLVGAPISSVEATVKIDFENRTP
jgi:serine/threonine protein kinase